MFSKAKSMDEIQEEHAEREETKRIHEKIIAGLPFPKDPMTLLQEQILKAEHIARVELDIWKKETEARVYFSSKEFRGFRSELEDLILSGEVGSEYFCINTTLFGFDYGHSDLNISNLIQDSKERHDFLIEKLKQFKTFNAMSTVKKRAKEYKKRAEERKAK